MDNIFGGCRIHIIPNGLVTKRIKLFQNQILKYGGEVVSHGSSTPTHIIIDENHLLNPSKVEHVLKANKLLREEDVNCDIVGTLWLSRCIKEKKLLSTKDFKVTRKRKHHSSESQPEYEASKKIQRMETKTIIIDDNINQCEYSGQQFPIIKIIQEFQKLAAAYTARGDTWRALAYNKAVASLKSYRKQYCSINDLKLLPHISSKMLDKILEIVEDGCCGKIEEICNDKQTQILEMFSQVWGAGTKTAQAWYQQGCRTLEDLYTKVNLTTQQEIGLKYYNEIQESIPRAEVEEILNVVKNAAASVDGSLQVMVGGSYRRGKPLCGDIDILVIARDTAHLLKKIIFKLKRQNFIIDDLTLGKGDTCSKYLGLCKLPGENRKIRRLDIFIIPKQDSGCAILHYTGSAMFNRGIRKHAKTLNMRLTEHGLTINGRPVPTPTEESIFDLLKLEYKAPENRETF